MITPKPGMVPREERPPVHTPLLVKLVVKLFGPLIRPFFLRRYADRENRLKEVSKSAQNCEDRIELERLFGPPRYVMHGRLFSGFGSPDIVEVYESRGFTLEILFKNHAMQSFIVYAPYSACEYALKIYHTKSISPIPTKGNHV